MYKGVAFAAFKRGRFAGFIERSRVVKTVFNSAN